MPSSRCIGSARAESHCVDRLNGHARPPKEAVNADERGGVAGTVAKCRKLILRRCEFCFQPWDVQRRGKPPAPPFGGGVVGFASIL